VRFAVLVDEVEKIPRTHAPQGGSDFGLADRAQEQAQVKESWR
jgi:hypothetical protein